MMGSEPGLTGTMKVTDNKVLWTPGETVSLRRPRVPQPRLDWTEAAFEFNFKWTSAMVLYVGAPTIGGIVGKGNPSKIFLMAFGMMRRD